MTKRLPDRDAFDVRFCGAFVRQARLDPIALIGSEPARLIRSVRQIKNGRNPEDNRRRPFHEKKPAPAGKVQPMDTENAAGYRTADHEANRDRRHETRHRFASIFGSEPMGEVNNYAWEKPGFGRTE